MAVIEIFTGNLLKIPHVGYFFVFWDLVGLGLLL